MTDQHLWAETYDRELTAANVFEVQDNITQQVVATLGSLHGWIYASVADSAQRKDTDNLEAYGFYHMGMHLMEREYTEESNRKIEQYLQKAIEKDPDFALSYMGLGLMEMRAYWGGWSPQKKPCARPWSMS
jgi:hypothetical protein